MKTFLFCLLIASLSSVSIAQKTGDTYQVSSSRNVNEVIPFEGRFQYPAFTDGLVHFRNGRTSKAKMNYSLLHGEVMFIDRLRDTLLLADNDFIDRVYIGQNLYYYYPGHGHILISADYGHVKLGKKEFLVQMGHEKYASYGQYSSTSAISSYSSFMNNKGEFRYLQPNEKVMMKRRQVYFLVDKNARFYVANRSNLMKIFPSRKSEINRFLKENDINLEIGPDLDKTLTFCNTM